MNSKYQIAGISITVDAIEELVDAEAFSGYRVPAEEENSPHGTESEKYTITLMEDSTMPEVKGRLVFEDWLNRVYCSEDEVLHLFHIPSTKGVAAWNKITDKNQVEIHYHPGARNYFMNSIGCFNVAGFERILCQFGKYLFHCSFIEYKGHAVLFSAPSGGGKTTQASLWEEYTDATIVNGDRGVLEQTRNGYLVHGLPIAGSSGVFLNRTLPLAAIFVVKKCEENHIVTMTHQEAFEAVYSELTLNMWNRQFTLDAVDFAMELARKVPIYQLECRIDEGAVETAREIVEQLI